MSIGFEIFCCIQEIQILYLLLNEKKELLNLKH